MIKGSSLKIAIASGKGGTGKTLLATNLAAYCSRLQQTLLVDLDVEEPNDFIFIKGLAESVSDQYKMIPEWDESTCTLCGICSQTCKYHAVVQLGSFIAVFKELCHGCYACSELCPANSLPMRPNIMGTITKTSDGNLLFLESRLNVGEEQAVPLINKTHQLVENEFGDIPVQIFDCPPGTSCPVVAATKKADYVVLVTEPTPFGLNDLKLAVETMRKLEKHIGVVINRYGIGNSDVEDYCARELIPVLAKIPFDRQIAGYYSRGELVHDKSRPVAEALQMVLKGVEETI